MQKFQRDEIVIDLTKTFHSHLITQVISYLDIKKSGWVVLRGVYIDEEN